MKAILPKLRQLVELFFLRFLDMAMINKLHAHRLSFILFGEPKGHLTVVGEFSYSLFPPIKNKRKKKTTIHPN